MNFGDRIKKMRKDKDWSQEYVANKLNISVGALSRYETGMFEPKSLSLVNDFATLFDVTTDYLLGKSDSPNSQEIDTDKIKIGLSKTEYGLPTKEQQDKIEEFARFILKDNLKKKEDK